MKNMETCSDYVGATCVNGSCPNALNEDFEDFETVSCEECPYNAGCTDCTLADTDMCVNTYFMGGKCNEN